MKYQPAIDIWNLSDNQRKQLPIGQWVYAGDKSVMGRFYGQNHATIIAWLDNGKRIGWRNYCRKLHEYGQKVISR